MSSAREGGEWLHKVGHGRALGIDWAAPLQVFRRHVDEVRATVAAYLPNEPELAEDVVSDVCERWLVISATFSDLDMAGHWLVKVARNRSLDVVRRAHRKAEVALSPEVQETTAGGEDPETVAVATATVEKTLAAIPPRHAQLLQERYLEGRSLVEMAESRQTTYNSIKAMLCRSLKVAQKEAARGAHVLMPLPVLNRLRRLFDEAPVLSRAGMAGLGALAVAAVTLTPGMNPAPPGPAPAQPAVTIDAGNHTVTGAGIRDTESVAANTAAHVGDAAGGVGPGSPAPALRTLPLRGSETIAAVPGTEHRITVGEAPPPDQEVSVGVEPVGEVTAVRAYDHPITTPVNETACTTAQASPALVSCTHGP